MISINGRRFEHGGESFISYYEVIQLAGYDRSSTPTVVYHTKYGAGTLTRDAAVEYSPGMTFTVADTGAA